MNLQSFKTIWRGGYYEGDPTDPMSPSGYGIFGFHSSLYLIYRVCIKPYITHETTVLEIGPGRGAWTKAIADLEPKRIYAVDVVDPEYAGFNAYVGRRPTVQHIQVNDCSLDQIPDNSVGYFFSFGCFCHIKPEMNVAYIQSLAQKMHSGGHGFLMVADYDKFNACVAGVESHSVWRAFTNKKFALVRSAWRLSLRLFKKKFVQAPLDKTEADSEDAGAWYHFGASAACRALEAAGFEILETDAEVCHRDPVVHFRKH